MRYSITILEQHYEQLRTALFEGADTERGAYLICRRSVTTDETRLLVREVIPVEEVDVLGASPRHISIKSRSYVAAMKVADVERGSFIFVHSHPAGAPLHSPQDDREEPALFRTAYTRIHNPGPHASIVVSDHYKIAGRVWLEDGTVEPIDRLRVIGKRFRFIDRDVPDDPIATYFDRQVRAFGPEIQRLLGRLRIGVVGAGGTGSAVIQQLTRLGVGHLIVSDGEAFEESNVNRVYDSRIGDDGTPKVAIVARSIRDIGLRTDLTPIDRPITFESVLKRFRDCDVIFGCTDDEWSRSLLTKFAIYYAIPVLDMGVQIDSKDGVIRGIEGRVTTLMPGAACLHCRQRITAERVGVEADRVLNPSRAEALREEGYAPELEDPAPAVIPFTTAVAASAVSELLHRLTGYMGDDRESTEVIHRLSETRLSRNRNPSKEGCFCLSPKEISRGDTNLFLNTVWRDE